MRQGIGDPFLSNLKLKKFVSQDIKLSWTVSGFDLLGAKPYSTSHAHTLSTSTL